MDAAGLMTRLESALTNQVMLAGDDPAVESAARLILAALEPAIEQAALEYARQAAAEVEAQLPEQRVEVVVTDGDPSLRVIAPDPWTPTGAYEARLTLRLPSGVKELVEQAAGSSGDSVNSWVVKALSSKAASRARMTGRRITGTVEL